MGSSEVLRRQDLRPGRGVVLVDELGHCARSLVRQTSSSGRLVVFRRGIHGVRRTAWFQAAVVRGDLREFSYFPFPSFADYWRADDAAFDAVEAVYTVLKQRRRVPVAPLVDLYDDEKVELAFKKALAHQIREFYQTVAALRLLSQDGRPVHFCPSDEWQEVRRWLGLAGMRWEMPDGVTIVQSTGVLLVGLESWFHRMKWLGILTALPLWVFLGMRWIARPPATPRPVQAAVRVYATDWGFCGEGTREIDWLLDGKELRRDNVLFVIEKPVSAKYRAEFARREYRVEDISGREAFRSVSAKFFVGELLHRGLWAWARLAAAGVRTPAMFLEVAARGWLEYLRWTAFLEHWRPRHLVAYNHIHYDHLFRNARLRSVGCSAWHYVHSIHDRSVLFDDSPARAIRTQIGRVYLAYDYEVHWGARDADLNRRSAGKAGAYLVLGPLWSAHVYSVPGVQALIAQRRKTTHSVAVFDTAFGAGSPHGEAGAREFYDAIAAMLDRPRWTSRLVLFKSKNDPKEFRAQTSPEVAVSLDRLLAHPRCVSLAADVAPGAVIAEADLTISIAFTSTTVEALGARRRAMYFDPGGRFRRSYYDRFPDLVAHDREDLARLCEYWLSLPEAEFQKYLDRYVAPEFGGHLDACAVERFRAALSARGTRR